MGRITDLKCQHPDELGCEVLRLYGKKAPDYAVYLAETCCTGEPDANATPTKPVQSRGAPRRPGGGDSQAPRVWPFGGRSQGARVMVQYADRADLNASQRRSMAPLNGLRVQISGLIDGWQSSGRRHREKAACYNMRLGYALVLGFEDDWDGAKAELTNIRREILDERTARARFEYVAFSFLIALIALALVGWTTLDWDSTGLDLPLWRAAAAGGVGACFSIATGIRKRTVLPDLQRLGNLLDAGLRVLIGVIGSGVLMAFIQSGAVNLDLGAATSDNSFYCVLVGFLGGFSERIVPDFLGKTSDAVAPTLEAPSTKAAATSSGAGSPPAAQASAQGASVPQPSNDDADGCICGTQIQPSEITTDEDLPPATGGVAAA